MLRSDKTNISFGLRRQEPLFGWTLAAGVLWLQISDLRAPSGGWAMALVAACVAGWAKSQPSTQRLPMQLRALLLILALGPWLMLKPELDAEPIFWMFSVTVFYGLLLSYLEVSLMVLLSLAMLTLAFVLQTTHALPADVLIQIAGLYCIVSIGSARVGQWIRKLDMQASKALIDPRTRLYNKLGFFNYGQILLEDSFQAKRSFCLVLINCDGLKNATAIYGKDTARLQLKQMVTHIQKLATIQAIAARTGAHEFALALPDMSAEQAKAHVAEYLGNPPVFRLGDGQVRTKLAVDVLIAQATPQSLSLEQLHERLHDELLQSRLAPEQAEGQSSLMILVDDIWAYSRRLDFELPN